MAKAKDFIQGMNQDLIINEPFQLAASEIYKSYGDKVSISRKTINKYGKATNLSASTETLIDGLNQNESYVSANDIDTISSSDAADTQTMKIEGMTVDANGNMNFVIQTAVLNGQNKVTLSTPLYRATRAINISATATAGDVYFYEDTAIVGGVPSDLTKAHLFFSQIEQSTIKCAFSIKSKNYLLITSVAGYVTRQSGSAEVDFRLKCSSNSQSFKRTLDFLAATNNTPSVNKIYQNPIIIPPNSDIELTAESTLNNTQVSASIHGVFADIV